MSEKLDRWFPPVARIVIRHSLGNRLGLIAQVFLVDDAVFANDEGHDAGISVIRRIRHCRKPTRHLSVNDVLLRAALRLVSLLWSGIDSSNH